MMAVDLYCGLGGWAEGFLAEGFDVIGFDIERHDYGTGGYPGHLVLQDVTTLHGAQLKDADVIVASPPCQAYSYRAMPWGALWLEHSRMDDDGGPAGNYRGKDPIFTDLFHACFRLRREASEAAGKHIPLIVENVKGAQKFVGRAAWHYGSYYLWGDVPALMPFTSVLKQKGRNFHFPEKYGIPSPSFHGADHEMSVQRAVSIKNNGGSWFKVAHNTTSGTGQNPVHHAVSQRQSDAVKHRDADGYDRNHPQAFGWKAPRTSSGAHARKAASAKIAKIPFELARWIARTYRSASIISTCERGSVSRGSV